MTNDQAVLTDPSARGQLIVYTNPLIGNCGVNTARLESTNIQASGLIANQISKEGFHYESDISLLEYCKKEGVPVLSGVDTRAIVKRIRAPGEMKAIMTTDPTASIQGFSLETPRHLDKVTTSKNNSYGED